MIDPDVSHHVRRSPKTKSVPSTSGILVIITGLILVVAGLGITFGSGAAIIALGVITITLGAAWDQ